MTELDRGIGGMISLAEQKGKELQELDKKNRKRAAKGKPPLPTPQDLADKEVRNIHHVARTPLTVDGAYAMRLFEERKAQMLGELEEDLDDLEERFDNKANKPERFKPSDPVAEAKASMAADMEKAVKEAAAARRVSDLKNGRINHQSVWEDGEQKLEGGDETKLPSSPDGLKSKSASTSVMVETLLDDESGALTNTPKPKKGRGKSRAYVQSEEFQAFRDDLYYRLKESFGGLESTLSDLQGRVSEIVTASASASGAQPEEDVSTPQSDLEELLSRHMPVAFEVGGANISFDALAVFHTSPCITVVYKMSSAAIKLKPGARIKLSYEMDGKDYHDDPVTYLGTRFELPMLGLSFMSFIRDNEANQLDVDAGISGQEP